MAFKPGDKVRNKTNFDIKRVVKRIFTNSLLGCECIDFTDNTWSSVDFYELDPEDEKPIENPLQDSFDKTIEIRQLKEELDIVYQALDYCVSKINYLTVDRFWQIETIKKMIKLRNLKNK